MTNSRKIMTAALAAMMAITMLSISTPASAWGRCGGDWGYRQWGYDGMALGAPTSYPPSYGYYGSAYPSGYGYYGSANVGYYGAASPTPVAVEGYYCATPVKTCLLSEPGWLGTGCSCKVSCGRARGIVE
jgi:hypothetical protein